MRLLASWRISAALALAVVSAAPAIAQSTGTRLDRHQGAPSSVSDAGTKSAIIVANGFGECLARREGKRLRAALDLPLMSAEQSKALKRSMDTFEGCLGTSSEFDQLRSSHLLVVGGAAEWFVKTELKQAKLSTLQGMTDDVLYKAAFRPRTSVEDLGLCIVRRDQARARAVIAARPTTAEEAAAFRAIVPEVGPCVSAGTELKLNIPNLRAVIAVAFYRAASMMEKSG